MRKWKKNGTVGLRRNKGLKHENTKSCDQFLAKIGESCRVAEFRQKFGECAAIAGSRRSENFFEKNFRDVIETFRSSFSSFFCINDLI